MYITNRYGEILKYKSYDSGRENGGKKLMVYKIKLVNSGTKRCQAGILQHQMLLKINLIIKTMFLSQLNRPLNRFKLIFIVNVITDCDHCKYYLLQYFDCLNDIYYNILSVYLLFVGDVVVHHSCQVSMLLFWIIVLN